MVSCAWCQKPGAVLQCGRCRSKTYCGRDCQRADWRDGHKEACRVAQAAESKDADDPVIYTDADTLREQLAQKMPQGRSTDEIEVVAEADSDSDSDCAADVPSSGSKLTEEARKAEEDRLAWSKLKDGFLKSGSLS
eukprot:TRINITY_DN113310_c0_g1_i1.p1 TRINITY_DN113310_c0_g1~~TRINITY_DN113310_c0_g1_i1.p1  ORF type:complete len:143 (-),score=34.21 TRINITY_DN113310_c0_g1_i1:164-571(-)